MATSRGQQRRQKGDPFGPSFSTPLKRRDKRKTTTRVPSFMGMREKRLLELRRSLGMPVEPTPSLEHHQIQEVSLEADGDSMDIDVAPLLDISVDNQSTPDETPWVEASDDDIDSPTRAPRRILPDGKAMSLYEKWLSLLPSLVTPALEYLSSTHGKSTPTVAATGFRQVCQQKEKCLARSTKINCHFLDHQALLDVPYCDCYDLPTMLVLHGLFPSSPTAPRIAFAIHLLDFYRSLFERSCDATNALATALVSFYAGRGYNILNSKGKPTDDPIRRSLTPALQWYGNLRGRVEQNISNILAEADRKMVAMQQAGMIPIDDTISLPISHVKSPQAGNQLHQESVGANADTQILRDGECARLLQRRCPACFGGRHFGRSFSEGGDIHVGVDGNFNHRHLRAAGDCPQFFTPEYILPKGVVDAVGARIDKVRKSPPRRRKLKVPDEAINDCESSHTAGSGSNQKTNMDRFDDGGLMALVCRHDIPLFAANIDTPGEQQKYAVALTEHLFSLLPSGATVAVLYDVGCVLDRSLNLYDILPDDICSRLLLATSAMHSYAHQWACQLVYNPRLRVGLGLTDGEGVERLWSRLRKLIGITRGCSRTRRIWLIDCQLAFIGADLRGDLGAWNQRKTKALRKFRKDASKRLTDAHIPVETLRDEWARQQEAQLSVRAHAPARLKKELDAVLDLQAEFDKVASSLRAAEELLGKFKGSKQLLQKLKKRSNSIVEKTDKLLSSLDIEDSFPELNGIDVEFVRLILLARDLKINIRKRAIGSFFEWDRLDQAVGGRDQTIGTRMHQATRGAISKRTPALQNAIKTYNKYCAQMASIYQPEWDLPLPQALPTTLTELRNSSHLWEDVWITRSGNGPLPRWLEDKDVRDGIRAMLQQDRCAEEEKRLRWEADNLCRWFGKELIALEIALSTDANKPYIFLLHQLRCKTEWLADSWSNPTTPLSMYQDHISKAASLSKQLRPDLFPERATAAPSSSPSSLDDFGDQGTVDVLGYEGAGGADERNAYKSEQVETSDDGEAFEDEETLLLEDILLETPGDTVKETVEFKPPTIQLTWDSPNAPVYLNPLDLLVKRIAMIQASETPPTLARHIKFSDRDLSLIGGPSSCLNDIALNTTLALILDLTLSGVDPTRQPALFSTHTFAMAQFAQPDDILWRQTRRTEFWKKNVWIIPIHRSQAQHWVLCFVDISTRQLLLFDSLAQWRPWRHDLNDIATLIGRLMFLALSNGIEAQEMLPVASDAEWVARPLMTTATQTNGYDCGVWVIAVVLVVLHGATAPKLGEDAVPEFRKALCEMTRMLPDALI